MNNLSLDERLCAVANNKPLQYYDKNLKQWFDYDHSLPLNCILNNEVRESFAHVRVTYDFPRSSSARRMSLGYVLDGDNVRGYREIIVLHPEYLSLGFWENEDDIKDVVRGLKLSFRLNER